MRVMLGFSILLYQFVPPYTASGPSTVPWMLVTYGDSRSVLTGYPANLKASINANSPRGQVSINEIRVDGSTVATRAAIVATEMAGYKDQAPDAVLFNLGVVDARALPAEAVWKADLATLLTAFRTKWPSATIYITRPWGRTEALGCVSIKAWIADVVAVTPGTKLGPDESVTIENGDDGATYTSDGLHYNAAGNALMGSTWKTVLGY